MTRLLTRTPVLFLEADERVRRLERVFGQEPTTENRRTLRTAYKRAGDLSARQKMALDQARRAYQHYMQLAKGQRDGFEPYDYDSAGTGGYRRRPLVDRANNALRRYVRLAHQLGIDPKHGLKAGAPSFDEHMAQIKHVSAAESEVHAARERAQADASENVPEHGAEIKHPQSGKVVGHWHHWYQGADDAMAQPIIPVADYRPHGRSYGTKKQQRPHLYVVGTGTEQERRTRGAVRKAHAQEIADVIQRDYGKQPEISHGARGSTVYVDRPEEEGKSSVIASHRIPTRFLRQQSASRAAKFQERAAGLPDEEAHPEMAKAHADVRERFDRAEKATRKLRGGGLWRKYRRGEDNGAYEQAVDDLRQATRDYHAGMNALHARAKELGVHPAHGFAPTSDLRNASKTKTRRFRAILADLHGADRGGDIGRHEGAVYLTHANTAPNFKREQDADRYEMALHKHVGGRISRHPRQADDGSERHRVHWDEPTRKMRATTQTEWVRTPLLAGLI